MTSSDPLAAAVHGLSQATIDLLRSLEPGQRIRLTQKLRVGGKKWTTTVIGAFRSINYLATGITTERVADDDIVVPVLHFTKDNGELSSIAIDEHSEVCVC
jgi:hypothetical protein